MLVEAYLGEIRIFSYPGGIPQGWAECNGQLLPIAQNQSLYSLLGTMYGGDGITTFALPDLQGRVAVMPTSNDEHGMTVRQGDQGGEFNVMLTEAQTRHTHSLRFNAGAPDGRAPANAHLACSQVRGVGYADVADATLHADAVEPNSFTQYPHPNLQPYLVLRFAIALTGAYTSSSVAVPQYIGEVRLMARSSNYVTFMSDWMRCLGTFKAISDYTVTDLYRLIGTTFGSYGSSAFALPNLCGRVAMGCGQGPGLRPRSLGDSGGQARVTLTTSQLPMHNHALRVSSQPGNLSSPAGAFPAASAQRGVGYAGSADSNGHAHTLGASPAPVTIEAHNNLQPYLGVDYYIAFRGAIPHLGQESEALANAYLGEIRLLATDVIPAGWLLCDGRLLDISGNEHLYSLLRTTYGGDGVRTFALPDLRGRVPLHAGGSAPNIFALGQSAGAEDAVLFPTHLPAHRHPWQVSSQPGEQATPAGRFLAASELQNAGYAATADSQLAPDAVSPTGASQPHNNLQPFLCLNYIICRLGAYPDGVY